MITLVDNYGQNSNDLVYMSGIKFEYKENKDYSKQIMKFINYVITLTRKPVNILGLKELEIRD